MHLDYDVHGYFAQPYTLDDIYKVRCMTPFMQGFHNCLNDSQLPCTHRAVNLSGDGRTKLKLD